MTEFDAPRHPGSPCKILLVDDDHDFLETYGKLLARLPVQPDVRTATSAARAFAFLEAEPFALMITDLRMPKVDGFQVLLTARRKYPALRTVVVTGLSDQQYRARAYAAGIDLFTQKPTTPTEIKLFSECVNALLQQAEQSGFRGLQNKSLMDLIQIECLSRNSTVLHITRGSLEGRVWIHAGNVIDAELQEMRGEEAFKRLFTWQNGNFEVRPGDAARPRTIFTSCEGLLLESAQDQDENRAGGAEASPEKPAGLSAELMPLCRVKGVDAVLCTRAEGETECWGLENPEQFTNWTHRLLRDFQALGQRLDAGPLRSIEAVGPVRGFVLLSHEDREIMAGIHPDTNAPGVRKIARELASHLGKP